MAALELARSHGRIRPALAARYLTLAGSAKGVSSLKELLLKVCGIPVIDQGLTRRVRLGDQPRPTG